MNMDEAIAIVRDGLTFKQENNTLQMMKSHQMAIKALEEWQVYYNKAEDDANTPANAKDAKDAKEAQVGEAMKKAIDSTIDSTMPDLYKEFGNPTQGSLDDGHRVTIDDVLRQAIG